MSNGSDAVKVQMSVREWVIGQLAVMTGQDTDRIDDNTEMASSVYLLTIYAAMYFNTAIAVSMTATSTVGEYIQELERQLSTE